MSFFNINKHKIYYVAAVLIAILMVSAAIVLGNWGGLIAAKEDNEASETILLMPMARQLSAGFGGLYGPYNRTNLLVLIHAPLYYRLGGVLAWPLTKMGLDPVSACLLVGRGLSIGSLLALLVFVARLSILGGAPRWTPALAVPLLVAAPVLSTLPVTVRPDMLGIALQTFGIFLVISALVVDRPKTSPILLAYVAFGLAFCTKQHLIAGPVVSTLLLLIAWLRHRVRFWPIERGVLLFVAIVAVIFGADEALTSGYMSQSVFRVAGSLGKARPVDWPRAVSGLIEVASKSRGLHFLLLAAGLATICTRPGWFRIVLTALGSMLILGFLAIFLFIGLKPWVIMAEVVVLFLVLPLIFLTCVLIEPRRLLGDRVDRALWAFLAGELVVMVILYKMNTGAWINYGIPAAIMGSVITARILSRASAELSSVSPFLSAVMASFIVLEVAGANVHDDLLIRAIDRGVVADILQTTQATPAQIFFLDRAGLNRTHGRADLVFDDWLYAVFESAGLAERRAFWLRDALASGEIHYVVTKGQEPRIEGVDLTLNDFGFIPSFRTGRLNVWKRATLRLPPRL